jgi:hypothetical protein
MLKGSEKERETGGGHLQDHVHLEVETRREKEIVTEIQTVIDSNALITAGTCLFSVRVEEKCNGEMTYAGSSL